VRLWGGPSSGAEDFDEVTQTWVDANKEVVTQLGELMSKGPATKGDEHVRGDDAEEITGGLKGKVRLHVQNQQNSFYFYCFGLFVLPTVHATQVATVFSLGIALVPH
jgi:hypothetical protein